MKTYVITLWDGTQRTFVNPPVYADHPAGLLTIGEHDHAFTYPTSSVKEIEVTRV